MRQVKKAVSLILVLGVIAAVLCGCGNDTQKLVGSWQTTIAMESLGNELEGQEELAEFIDLSQLSVDFHMELNDDGTYKMMVTPESAAKAADTMLSSMVPYIEQVLLEQLQEQGVNITLEEFFTLTGTSMEALLSQYIDRDAIVNEMVNESTRTGRYTASKDKLFFSDSVDVEPDKSEYEPYSFDGDVLLLTEDFGGNAVTLRLERVS